MVKLYSEDDLIQRHEICKVKNRSLRVIIDLSELIRCMTPRVNPNINWGLWVMVMRQCRFISWQMYHLI